MNRKTLTEHIFSKRSFLCVGLDTDPEKLPSSFPKNPEGMFQFNKEIIEATKDHCVAYKINTAFYEAEGLKGWECLEKTAAILPSSHFKIADAKRGDIGNTSGRYAKAFFNSMPFDAVTVAPYMGKDSLEPFFAYENKWVIVLALTSNKGSADFEQLQTNEGLLYQKVITEIQKIGTPENLMFVVGATQSKQIEEVRKIARNNYFLVPGVGAQGGSLDDVVRYGMTSDCGLLVNASRSILYASQNNDFAEKAKEEAYIIHQQMKDKML